MSVILTYHYFGVPGGPDPGPWRRDTDKFEADLRLVAPRVISLDEALAGGDGIVLTFDDGRYSQLDFAVPLMERWDVVGTFYIPTAYIGQEFRGGLQLGWDQLEGLAAAGHSIQSHSHTHALFAELGDDELSQELMASRDTLSERFDGVRHIATPHGAWEPRVAAAAEAAGYASVRTTHAGQDLSDPYRLPSYAIQDNTDLAGLLGGISEPSYWEDIYSGRVDAEPGGHEHLRYDAMLPLVEGPNVVDIGAGYAGFTKQLRAAHFETTAVDFSAAAKQASGYEPYVVTDATDMPFDDGSFDTAIISCTLEYVEEDHALLAEAKRVAKTLILVVPKGKHDRCSQLREYTVESVEAMLTYYGIVEVCEEQHGFILAKVRHA